MRLTRLVGIVALALGVLGVGACGAAAYGVWFVASRLDRANDTAFAAIDRGLGAVEGRIPVVRQRVGDAKVTAAEAADAVQAWAAKEVRDRVVGELEIGSRAERLSGQLQAVELRLDASAEAVLAVREVIELGQALGARVDPAAADQVLELLASLRVEVREAGRAVDDVRRFAAPAPGESVADRLARVAKLLARTLLALGGVERRLDDFATRLAEARAGARQLKARTGRSILLGSAACHGVLAWAAAGQAALCGWGYWRCRRGRPPVGRVAG